MPVVHSLGKHSYRLVEDKNDGLGKVPAYDEEAFQLGITFKAKYVGTLEITRPTCRAEIVTAMRKVRYEFKIKGIEKRRVNLIISVDGIKVTVRKRRRRMRKEKYVDEEPVVLHEHQIGRIFYVSHDSMDLKIFSYITKDNFDNQFRCSVFKAYRKSKALFVVRTIGQAFEVCHRLQHDTTEERKENGQKDETPKVDEAVLADTGTDIDAVDLDNDEHGENFDIDQRVNVKPMYNLMEINQLLSPVGQEGQILTIEQLRLLFNQHLGHFVQEIEVFKAENQLLKDQLVLERNGRTQAQEREHCLLQKNRELLHTIQALTARLQTGNSGDTSWDTTLNPTYPTMYSTPRKENNYLIDLLGNNSVVIPSIQPTPKRIAPLATVENSSNSLQTTVGLHWKTFDEDDHVASPSNATDDSTSDSSDEDDAFSDSVATKQGSEKTNGCKDVKLLNGGAVSSLGTKPQNNGVVYNGLSNTVNNNNLNKIVDLSKVAEVRPAIQTDF